jgi:hypothetical protein
MGASWGGYGAGRWARRHRTAISPSAEWPPPASLLKIPFSYMTSSGRLFVPLLFNFRLPVLHINGRGQAGRILPSRAPVEDE